MQYGYARVSTSEQDTDLQIAALHQAGIQAIYEEKRSAVATRPQLARLLAVLQPSDTVVVYKIDRLARSLSDLLAILRRIEDAGAGFRSLTEPVDTTTPVGRLMLQQLGAFAEFERALIRERCITGLHNAMARGVRVGRPRIVNWSRVIELYAQGLPFKAIARHTATTARNVKRILLKSGMLPASP